MTTEPHTYLPPEIIAMIAKELAMEHPPSLLNLARADRTCYAGCRLLLKSMPFHDIILEISPSPLEHDLNFPVEQIVKQLREANAFRHVRQIFFCYGGPDSRVTMERFSVPQVSDLQREVSGEFPYRDATWRDSSAPRNEPIWLDRSLSNPWPRTCEQAWTPVINLIKMLPRLTDLIWRYPEQFPISLLSTLHLERPQCRVHLHSFWLDTLFHPEAKAHQQDIFMSPCLHAIKLSELREQEVDYTRFQGLLRVLELAPNLKKVHLKGCLFADPTFTGNKGLSRLPALEVFYLDIYGLKDINIAGWSKFLEFSNLRTLRIDAALSDETMLRWIATETVFPSLKILSLSLNQDWTPELYRATTTFLMNLPLLYELELDNWHKLLCVTSILQRHGPWLRKLKLLNGRYCQSLNEKEILEVGKHCPLLEDLEITILRTQGDSNEVVLYKSLGTIKNLQRLYINYEISPVDPYRSLQEPMSISTKEAKFDDQIWPWDWAHNITLRNGDVRRVMINVIIDTKLACAIFQAISNAKAPGCPLLQEFTIKMQGTRVADDIGSLICLFGSQWWVERDTRPMHREALIAKELDPQDWLDSFDLFERLQPIFYQLFPEAKPKCRPRRTSEGSEAEREKRVEDFREFLDWRRWMHSFPLSSDADHGMSY
ncbi:hypothetical protein N7456_011981 [Penicillium angulare]|uniref:F-box domain-containing protein n=1 Tax=Penicillium angulare TaxID=116970 RepID=A0A9W9K0L3_9EURO|nr:hypothetical protein N7456_011981 [Penicillium angulare]